MYCPNCHYGSEIWEPFNSTCNQCGFVSTRRKRKDDKSFLTKSPFGAKKERKNNERDRKSFKEDMVAAAALASPAPGEIATQ